ncbi:MAG: hypothetical protein HG447_009425 [Prevotella sp.]|nr:hypothetical protein [Prevotella sp.]
MCGDHRTRCMAAVVHIIRRPSYARTTAAIQPPFQRHQFTQTALYSHHYKMVGRVPDRTP